MGQKNEKKINRDVNRISELERRIKEGRCDPSSCSGLCPDCPMELSKNVRRTHKEK